MTEDEKPERVAAASLSPVSPRPLHNTYTLPQVLPELQDRAEDPNVVPFEPTTFRTAAAAMATVPEPTLPHEDTVVDESDDDSFDYGDDDNDQGGESAVQEAPQEAAGPENDDYARTFDSPTEKEQAEIETVERQDQQPLHHVSSAPESMNIFEQPDAVPTQSQSVAHTATLDPSIANLATEGFQAIQPTNPVQDVAVPQPTENSQEPSPAAQEALPDTTTTQPSVSAPRPEMLEADVYPHEAAPKKEEADVQPYPEDVDMNTESVADATALDIQKLVDEITAKAESTSDQPVSQPPPASAQTASSSVDVDLSSLPPKPALTQEQSKQTYSPASYHHASLPNAPNFPASAALPSQPTYANAGAPGTTQPQTQPQTYSAAPSFASYPNAYPPGTAPQAPGFDGQGIQQTFDEFLADERRHMAEAKWERFPDGSRIFIGKPPKLKESRPSG